MSVQDFTRGTSAFGDEVSQEPQKPQHPNISAAITDAAQKNQVVFIGDTDHRSLKISNYLNSPELLDAAQKGGIKHIFLEMDANLQDLPDRLSRGELSRDEFVKQVGEALDYIYLADTEEKQQFEDMADFILGAKERGMKVHFGDKNGDDSDLNTRLNETDSVKYALDIVGDQKFMMIWGAAHDAPREYLDKLGIKNHTIDIIDSSGQNPGGFARKEPNAKAYLREDAVEAVTLQSHAQPSLKQPQLQPVM